MSMHDMTSAGRRPPRTGAAAALAVALLAGCSGSKAKPPQGVESFSGLAQKHVESPVSYRQDPPVGGPHFSTWQNCGFYAEAVRNEHAVHSLEHGAVWISYRDDLATAGARSCAGWPARTTSW